MKLRGSEEKKNAKRPLRIGYITESYVMGGVERFTSSLINHLDKDEYEVVLICRELSAVDPLVEDVRERCQVIYRTELLDEKHGISSIARIWKMRNVLKKLHLDLLHGQILGGDGGRWMLLAARLAGVPVILTIHLELKEEYSKCKKWLARNLERLASAYVCVSENGKQKLIVNAGMTPDLIFVIHNGVELKSSTISRFNTRSKLSIENDVVAINIARIEYIKGQDILLEAIAKLGGKAPLLLLAGDGEDREKIETKARDIGLKDDKVRFLGFRNDIPDLLAASDFFILPSRTEGLPLSILEAMASNLPIIATSIGGIPELVKDKEHGFLIPPDDVDALAEAIGLLTENSDLRDKLGENCAKQVEEHFSFDAMSKKYRELYEMISRSNGCN